MQGYAKYQQFPCNICTARTGKTEDLHPLFFVADPSKMEDLHFE